MRVPKLQDIKKVPKYVWVLLGVKLVVKLVIVVAALWIFDSSHNDKVAFGFAPVDANSQTTAQNARGRFRERMQERRQQRQKAKSLNSEDLQIAGLKVAVWLPRETSQPHPIVIFSHGFHGGYRQSESIAKAIADAGYIVFSPNHADAMNTGKVQKVEVSFKQPSKWSDTTYSARRDDICKLIAALKQDPKWNRSIDWSQVGLVGHSLGGYTVLGLAGAWPSWKLPDVKAVVALSPYATPYMESRTLKNLNLPVMYQTGTADIPIKTFVAGPNGAFSQTSSPSELVVFDKANHFTWSNLNRQQSREDVINHYCVTFLNRYVKGDATADPETRIAGVSELKVNR